MRNSIKKIHLWLGLSSGLIVFIVSVTGCLYAFEEEISSYLNRDLLFVSQPFPEANKVSIDQAIDSVKKQYPKESVRFIRYSNDAQSSIGVFLKNRESVYVNPYTAKVLGSQNNEKGFFNTVLKIHRTLYLGEAGKKIIGISTIVFIVLIISGIVLWWPRTKNKLHQKFSVLKNAKPGRRVYDLHSVFGFYVSVILLVSALTGLVISFKWMGDGVYFLTGSKKTDTKKIKSVVVKDSRTIYLQNLLAEADKHTPAAEEYFISIPEDSTGVYRVTPRYNLGGIVTKYDQCFFDKYSGKLIKFRPYESFSSADKYLSMNKNIHTGQLFGLTGKFIVFFASLISASLPITGFLFWWMRIKKRSSEKTIREAVISARI